MEPEFRIGAVIPTYRHIERLPAILARLRQFGVPVLIVDDGNEPDLAAKLKSLADPQSSVDVIRRKANGGKGAAMKTGFAAAAERAWTHALQLDADGQHDLEAAPRLIDLARRRPEAVIGGVPVYDKTAPWGRRAGRQLTHAMVWLETASLEISDSMCGFRIYPVGDALAVIRRELIGARMDYDTDILVHLFWRGLQVIETPVKVTYPENNVSNFRMLSDNVRMTLLHIRLVVQMPVRAPIGWWRRRAQRRMKPA